MDPLFSRARTRSGAPDPRTAGATDAPRPTGGSQRTGTPRAARRGRTTPRVLGALLVAAVAGTGLGAAGAGTPASLSDGSTVLADGAKVDISGRSSGASQDLDRPRDGEQASRSQTRDAGGIDPDGAPRREAAAAQASEAQAAERAQQVADAEAAQARDAAAAAEAAAQAQAQAERQAVVDAALADPRSTGRAMAAERGWGDDQFRCLDSLWTKESDWTVDADNPTSSAYGIPQSLPGEKMAADGEDWATNPITQISWGLTYIRDVYGSPCSAWAHSQATDWY